MIININNPPLHAVEISRQGENEFREIEIDVSAWLAEYPDGKISVIYCRPDGELYPVIVNAAESPIIWRPTATDTTVSGVGAIEVRIQIGDVLGKSCTIAAKVLGALGVPGGTPAAPAPDWARTVTEDADRAEAAAEKAEAASTHMPQISASKTWLVWDANEGKYVDTGVSAGAAGADGITPTIGDNGNWYLGETDTGKPSRGADGATGATGEKGADGKSAYAYAVEGGYTGTEEEFAAKLAEEMPDALPNPNALTFTGAVTGSYDGSEPLTVEIPSGGGGNVAVAITDMDGYKIAPTGTILVATAGMQLVSAPITVTAGEELRITASSKYGNSLYALYDASGAMVDNQTAAATAEGTAVEEMSVTVHADAVTLRVAWDKAVTDTAYAVIRVGGQTAPDWPLVGVKCAVIGDSVIEAAAAPNAGLVELMAASTGAEIVNLGVGGTGWMRGQEEGAAYYQRVTTIPADTQRVIFYGSGNDRELALGDPADTGTETVCGCVNATLDAVYAHVPTAWVGIIAPAPWQHYPPYESGNAMELLAQALGAICRRRGVPYLDLYHSSGLRPWDDAFRELAYNEADGIHPNATGYGLIAPQCSAFLVGGGAAAKLAEETGTVPENVALLEDVTADEASGDFIPMLSQNGTEYRLSIGDDGVPAIKNVNGVTVWSGTSGGSSGGGEEPGGDNPGSDTPTGEWVSGAEVAYTLVDGEWVKDDGSFVSGDSDSRTDFIYCYGAGHIYHSCAASASVRIVFYDINKQFVSKQGGYYRYNAIPENAAYVVMSFITESITGSVIKLYKKVEPTWTDGEPYEFTFIENEYVDGASGEFIEYSGWKRTNYVNCAGATKITKTNASAVCYYGAFYNAEKERIAAMPTPDTTEGTSANITVPVGACYFITSDSNANMDALVLVPYSE